MSTVLLSIIAAMLVLPGILMAIVPGLPGHIYMFTVAFMFAAMTHFTIITQSNLIVLAVVTLISMVFDIFSGVAGAKYGGAHWSSLIAGTVGLVAGTIVIPIPIVGSVAGLFIGVFLYELYRGRDVALARKAATGSFVGSLVGIAGGVSMAILFMGLFVYFLMF